MNDSATDNAPIIVKGIPVERRLLEPRQLRRCELRECQAHCCSCGVYLKDDEAKRILAHAPAILPHLPAERHDPQSWFDWNLEPDHDHPDGGMLASTNVVNDPTHPAGSTCVFLREDRKCALQVASVAAGRHPWDLKPFYCALYPLVYHQRQLILDDENLVYLEGGTCTRGGCGDPKPLYQLLDVEMKLALGDDGYAEFTRRAELIAEGNGSPRPRSS
jgi:hypothetical protein